MTITDAEFLRRKRWCDRCIAEADKTHTPEELEQAWRALLDARPPEVRERQAPLFLDVPHTR